MQSHRLSRICVVEDKPADAVFLKRAMTLASRQPVQIDVAASLADAEIRLRGDRPPDCAFLDVGVADCSGPLDALSRLKAVLPELPVIVIAPSDDPDIEIASISAGAQDFLVTGTIDGNALLRSARRSIERKRLELTVAETRADFAALAGHELRTPLTSISGYVELLRDGELGELRREQEHALSVVARAAQRVEHIVGDLMVLADGDAGRLQVQRDPVDLADLVREAVRLAGSTARDVSVELDSGMPDALTIRADAPHVRHFVDSLLGGVVAVSPIGGRVTVGLRRGDGVAIVTVAGLGMGLPAEKAQELLDRCRRSPGPAALPALGLALGVAINVGEAHGGYVDLKPDPGGGSTISVALPLDPAAAAPPEPQFATSAAS
ncbi:MAG: histidine kinase dimerization/phospho-acceptor domain-containing protein [Miltoncostaeaceae bacterium]